MHDRFQVVDAEVVLTNLILPHETVLLPFKDVPFESAAIGLATSSFAAVTDAQAERMIAGYVDLFARLITSESEISKVLTENVSTSAPVRVILRNTNEYRDILEGRTTPTNLLAEEQAQLKRGDVPYFFKRLGSDDLLWVSDNKMTISKVETFTPFQADVDRHARCPDELMQSLETKMAQGLFLLQKRLNRYEPLEFRWNGGGLKIDSSGCTNSATGKTFRRTSKT